MDVNKGGVRTVYLFTNVNRGGRGLIDVLAKRTKKGSCRGIVVLSSRNWLKLNGLSLIIHLLKQRIFSLWYSAKTNLSVHISKDINSDNSLSCVERGDAGIVAGFDQIFSADLVSRFGSLVNFHWSLLPYYRGPIPTHWCLENREQKTGITLHRLTPEIDKGEIIHQEIEDIALDDDAFTLRSRLWVKAVPVFNAWLSHLTEEAQFAGKVVDAQSIYKVHVDYKGYY